MWDIKTPTRAEWIENKLAQFAKGLDITHPVYLPENKFYVPETKYPIYVGARYIPQFNKVYFEFHCIDPVEGGDHHEAEYTTDLLDDGNILLFDREWDHGWNYLSPDVEIKLPDGLLNHLIWIGNYYQS